MPARKYATDEERKRARRTAWKAWSKTPEGVAYFVAYRQTAKHKAARKKWGATGKGRACSARAHEKVQAQRDVAKAQRRAEYDAWAASLEGRAELAAQEDARQARQRAKSAERYARPEVKAYHAAYAKTPQGRANLRAGRHRRRKEGGGPLKTSDVVDVYKTRICHYCGVGLDSEAPRGHLCRTTMDHKIPLKRGGSNERENLVAACWSCNCRKNLKTAEEFIELLGRTGPVGTLRDRSGPTKPRATVPRRC